MRLLHLIMMFLASALISAYGGEPEPNKISTHGGIQPQEQTTSSRAIMPPEVAGGGIPIRILGSSRPEEICITQNPYSSAVRTTGNFNGGHNAKNVLRHITVGSQYRIYVGCQPREELCSVDASRAQGTLTAGMPPVDITCVSKDEITGTANIKRNHVWALNATHNQKGFPLLSSLDLNNPLPANYVTPAPAWTKPAMTTEWAGGGTRPTTTRDYTLIDRTVGSINPYESGVDTSVYFSGWAFFRKFIAFGGESNKGSHVVAPHPDWVRAAHSNGVPIYGTVFIANDNAFSDLTDSLIGSDYSCASWDNDCTITAPTIDKLAALARTLHIDGWLLNIEAGTDVFASNSSARSRLIQNLIKYKFTKISDVDFVVYSNVAIPGTFSDGQITDLGKWDSGANGMAVDDATGFPITEAARRLNFDRTYVLYLNEPIFRNTPIGNEQPLPWRGVSARQAVCTDLLNGGSSTFIAHTDLKYPSSKTRAQAVCAGDTNAPTVTRTLVVKVPPGVNVDVKTGNYDSSAGTFTGTPTRILFCNGVTPQGSSEILYYSTCYVELPSSGGTYVLDFTGDNWMFESSLKPSGFGTYNIASYRIAARPTLWNRFGRVATSFAAGADYDVSTQFTRAANNATDSCWSYQNGSRCAIYDPGLNSTWTSPFLGYGSVAQTRNLGVFIPAKTLYSD
ncbi:hypothetical protein ACIOZM_30655 [Pseudomonas sp. NPDC087346]|uniref:endo-beta-N-acetylglucosaminidase n=1 Tax=Pseudomonas sp. NPDC087346 TaxID=3364438 RepID=UPI0037FF1250